jgi:hypothetical protein
MAFVKHDNPATTLTCFYRHRSYMTIGGIEVT